MTKEDLQNLENGITALEFERQRQRIQREMDLDHLRIDLERRLAELRTQVEERKLRLEMALLDEQLKRVQQ